MPATTWFHHGITKALLQETAVVFHHPLAFHPTHGVFNMDSDGGHTTMGRCLGRSEFPATWGFLGWTIVMPGRKHPWKPFSGYRHRPGGRVSPASSARLVSCAFPSSVALKKQMCQVSSITRRLLPVCHVFLPREVSGCSAGSVGRWIGRSGPSGPPGGAWARPSFVRLRATRPPRRPYGRGAALEALTPDSAPPGGEASTGWRSLGTSHRVVLGLLGGDAVSRTSG
jgi:hypothetical protein